jgi:hypothetical protein
MGILPRGVDKNLTIRENINPQLALFFIIVDIILDGDN